MLKTNGIQEALNIIRADNQEVNEAKKKETGFVYSSEKAQQQDIKAVEKVYKKLEQLYNAFKPQKFENSVIKNDLLGKLGAAEVVFNKAIRTIPTIEIK